MTTLTLEPRIVEKIEQLLATGHFASASDVVGEALDRLVNTTEMSPALRAAVQKGIDDFDAGRSDDADVVFDRLILKYEAMTNAEQR